MTPEDIEKVISPFVRDRKAMLWVCQRHDLVTGAEPHDYDLPASAALLRYRDAPSETDRAIAGLFWECVWLEGARSPLLDAIRNQAHQGDATAARQAVVLAGSNDAGVARRRVCGRSRSVSSAPSSAFFASTQ